jgi:hypothetical protein
LAVGAACDFYHASFFIPLAISLSRQNFIRLQLCYWLRAVPAFAVLSSVWVVIFVGLDRLFCVLFPVVGIEANLNIFFFIQE